MYTVSFHNFKSQDFKLSVSNPKSTYVAYSSVLSQISNCQGLCRKNKHENLKTDRSGERIGRGTMRTSSISASKQSIMGPFGILLKHIEHRLSKSVNIFPKGDGMVGNPHRARISQFEFFELILLLKVGKQFPVAQFEAAASQSTVPSPPS